MSYTDKSSFDVQRDRLIGEIAENLARCVTNVNQLNRNIESVVSVGAVFEPVHALWKQFENVMANAPQTAAEEPILQQSFPAGTDETAVMPEGIAPGGGEVAALSGSIARD